MYRLLRLSGGKLAPMGAVALATVLCSLALAASPAPAGQTTSFAVTTTSDLPGTTCAAICSLRQAVGAANASGTTNVITFSVNGIFTLSNGELHVTGLPAQTLTIRGNGRVQTVIRGGGAARVLEEDTGATVRLARITIEGGNAGGDNGGGILNFGALTLTDASVSSNTAFLGGGIFNGGTLNLAGATVSGNTAGFAGGGLRNEGAATLIRSSVAENSAVGRAGGGIANSGTGTLSLVASSVTGNSSLGPGGGGGIASLGVATFVNSLVAGNSAVDHGGGIANAGPNLIFRNGVIRNNTVSGTAPFNDGGGIANYGSLTLDGAIVSDNNAGNDGGGIANDFGADARLTRVIAIRNAAGNNGGGIANETDEFDPPGTVTLTQSVVTGNRAGSTAGGVFNPSGTVTLDLSAVRGNTPDNCRPIGSVSTCTDP